MSVTFSLFCDTFCGRFKVAKFDQSQAACNGRISNIRHMFMCIVLICVISSKRDRMMPSAFYFFYICFLLSLLNDETKAYQEFPLPTPIQKPPQKTYPSISIAVAPRRALVDVNGTQLDGNGIKYESIRSFPQICLNSSFIKSYLRSIFKVRVDLRSIVILF